MQNIFHMLYELKAKLGLGESTQKLVTILVLPLLLKIVLTTNKIFFFFFNDFKKTFNIIYGEIF
jgi:hypothetical protein